MKKTREAIIIFLSALNQILGIEDAFYYNMLKSTSTRRGLQGNQGKMLFNMNVVSLCRLASGTENSPCTDLFNSTAYTS